ncbi:ASTRA complex subunit [Tulasnella sp. 419]|nr:ASTRA complex subunit [Tulasnella sp. 419]
MLPQAPSPRHILRTHGSSITAVHLSDEKRNGNPNERLYTGDADGIVVITDTVTLRPLTVWKAHEKGILGVEEWRTLVITHGRDNKLHFWTLSTNDNTIGVSAAQQDIPLPVIVESLDVNALNFCRFSLLDCGEDKEGGNAECLIALPNLVDSALVDIWRMPGCKRLQAAIGKAGGDHLSIGSSGEKRSGIVMALHLMRIDTATGCHMRVLVGYENGMVVFWSRAWDETPSIEGMGWEGLWNCRPHNDAVMCMAVSPKGDLAFTVSADSLVARISLDDDNGAGEPTLQSRMSTHQTKHPGNGSLAIRSDGRVCAIGGWDGKIRLYSTKSLKGLGTLIYHKGACNALAFAHSNGNDTERGNYPSLRYNKEEKEEGNNVISRWLAAGGMDHRVTLWELMSFERGESKH